MQRPAQRAWHLAAALVVVLLGGGACTLSSRCGEGPACPSGEVCHANECHLECNSAANCKQQETCVEGVCLAAQATVSSSSDMAPSTSGASSAVSTPLSSSTATSRVAASSAVGTTSSFSTSSSALSGIPSSSNMGGPSSSSSGPSARQLVAGLPGLGDVHVDGNDLYWTQPGTTHNISSCPLPLCSASSVQVAFADGGLAQIVWTQGSTLYWTRNQVDGRIRSCSLSQGICSGAATVAVGGLSFPSGGASFAVNGNYQLLWTTNLTMGEVATCTGACTTPITITALDHAWAVALSGNTVFIASSARRGVYSAPLDGSLAQAQLFHDSATTFSRALFDVAIQGSTLYWVDIGHPPAFDGLIGACSLGTGTTPSSTVCASTAHVVVGGLRGPTGLAVTTTDLYWAELESGAGGTASPALGRIMTMPLH